MTYVSRFTFHVSRFFLVALCSLTVHAFAAEPSVGSEAGLKKVIITKQFGAARDIFKKQTEAAFLVDMIKDTQGIEKGLSGREGMPEHYGMLFVLDASQEHAFWMQGMRFPLDILFFGADMKITEILENLHPCDDCSVYFPKMQPAYALEINAGLARKLGLSAGDIMVLEK